MRPSKTGTLKTAVFSKNENCSPTFWLTGDKVCGTLECEQHYSHLQTAHAYNDAINSMVSKFDELTRTLYYMGEYNDKLPR